MAYTRVNIYSALTAAMKKAFSGEDVSQLGPAIHLLNNTPLYSLNAANTTPVPLIKASGSDVATVPGALAVEGALSATSFANTGAATILGLILTATARTATVTGATTGTILPGEGFVEVTSANAAHIIKLPAPVPGTLVVITVGANGYELASSAPATVGINGGTGASVSSAIGAGVTAFLFCASATNWIGWQLASDGTLTKVETAA